MLLADEAPATRAGGLAPSRRSDLARFGIRAMVAGNLAAFMSATLAGMIL